MIDSDWHWLAGIWEGEGTAVLLRKNLIYKTPSRCFLSVSICQKYPEMLHEVKRIVGYGTLKYHGGENRRYPTWDWAVYCRQARDFLNKLRPFVRSPHKLAQLDESLRLDKLAREIGAAKAKEHRSTMGAKYRQSLKVVSA